MAAAKDSGAYCSAPATRAASIAAWAVLISFWGGSEHAVDSTTEQTIVDSMTDGRGIAARSIAGYGVR